MFDENLVEILSAVFAPGRATHFAKKCQKTSIFEGYLTPVTFVFGLEENEGNGHLSQVLTHV